MTSALRSIALASDFAVVRAFDRFHDELLRGSAATFEQITAGLTTLPGHAESILPLSRLIEQGERRMLSQSDSVALARRLFVAFAEHPSFGPTITRCIQEWPDDVQRVSAILSVGVVGSVWLCLISTSVHYKEGELEIHKEPISAPQLSELTKFVQPKIEAAVSVRLESSSPVLADSSSTQVAAADPVKP